MYRDPIAERGLLPTSHWLLEAGEDPWTVLAASVSRRIDEMVVGSILEIISWVPDIGFDIASWCGDAGHNLLHTRADGASTRYWIEKRGDGDEGSI